MAVRFLMMVGAIYEGIPVLEADEVSGLILKSNTTEAEQLYTIL